MIDLKKNIKKLKKLVLSSETILERAEIIGIWVGYLNSMKWIGFINADEYKQLYRELIDFIERNCGE